MANIINNRPPAAKQSVFIISSLLLTFLFVGLALLQLALVNANLSLTAFLPLLVLTLCGGAAITLLYFGRAAAARPDPILLVLTLFLSGLGLVLTARLAPAFLARQEVWLGVSTALLLAVTLLPQNLNWLRRYKYTWLSGGLVLLAATLVWGVNPSGYGARLWLNLGDFYVQPSEPLKLGLIVFLAAYLADRRRQLVEVKAYLGPVAVPHPSYFGPMLLMWGFSIVLLIWQRDLGAALLFFGVFVGLLYTATGQTRYLWAGLALLLVAGVIGYDLFDVVQLRIEAFANPWLDPSGRSFQIVQSLLAFSSGGFLGQGLGQGLPTAIPVVHTDFVFAAIGEEYGLWGAAGILLCFALLVSRAFHIALRAKTGFEQLLAAGIGLMLGLQTIIITAGTLKLLPLTGVTLPLVSYGGSSLATSWVMVALLLFISVERTPLNAPPSTLRALPMAPYFLRLFRALLTGFLVVAGGLVLWQIVAAPFLVKRDDNPRPVIAEQKILRGRLLAADNTALAETTFNADGLRQRRYPYPNLTAVTGFYSLRYGVGGAEELFDPLLRGNMGRAPAEVRLDEILHLPPVGQDVPLTIHLPAQLAADAALGPREGAVVIMDIETGAILVMSSHPTYDPNRLDEQWDTLRQDKRAPLLNRATQGLFPVGDLARLVGLIGLYEAGATVPPDPLTAPLADMLAPLGSAGYSAAAYQLGLTRFLPGLPSQPGLLPDFAARGTARDLAVTPLHLARAVAALELDGRLPTPVLALTTPGGSIPAIRPVTAQRSRALLRQIDKQVIGLNGQANLVETGQTPVSWFVGLAPTIATASPPAAPAGALTLDPAQIKPTSTPAPSAVYPRARYVVAVVVVTDEPGRQPALEVALAAIKTILNRP